MKKALYAFGTAAAFATVLGVALSTSGCSTSGTENPCFKPGYPGPSHPCPSPNKAVNTPN